MTLSNEEGREDRQDVAYKAWLGNNWTAVTNRVKLAMEGVRAALAKRG